MPPVRRHLFLFALASVLVLSFCYLQIAKHTPEENFNDVRAPASDANTTWPTFRGGYLNQGVSRVSLRDNKQNAPVISTVKTLGLIWGSAVIDENDTIYVGSADKKMYAIDQNGQTLWTYSIFNRADAVIDSAAALTKTGKLVVPGGDGYLHILRKTDGKLLAQFKSHGVSDASQQQGGTVNSFEGNVQIGPNGWIYAGSDNGHMYAVTEEGEQKWDFTTQNMIWSSPTFSGSDNKWMAFGSLDKNFYLLNPTTGKMYDSFTANGEVKSSPLHDGHGNLYVGSSGNVFYAFKVVGDDGGYRLLKNWEFKTQGEVYSSPALWNKRIVFGSLEGTLYCLDTSGELVWKFPVHSPISSSPVISADGIAVFGAKNGTMYAIDVKTGERVWSAKVTPALLKSNLDASPAISSTGFIYNGSYDNTIYKIPSSFCSTTKASNCKFGGREDMPDLDGKIDPDGATLRFVSREGELHRSPKKPVGLTETLQLRLIALKNGSLVDGASIRATHVDIDIQPYADFDMYVSSDGSILNILPTGYFKPNTHYHLDITGTYNARGGWIGDRFAFLNMQDFKASLDFTTKADDTIEFGSHELLGIQSLYLAQPQALDTYVPAAMDGQGFLASIFGYNPENGHFVMLVHPGLPVHGAVPTPLAEPTKAFVLNGSSKDGSIHTTGKMNLAAMGGEIPFTLAEFRADLTPDHNFGNASFFLVANCLDIKGNGSSYSFPYSLLNQLCDFKLRMIGVGTLESKNIPIPAAPAGMHFRSLEFDQDNDSATVSFTSFTPSQGSGNHLLSVVRYEPGEAKGTYYGVVAVDARTSKVNLPLKVVIEDADTDDSDVLEIFFDQTPVASCTVAEAIRGKCRASQKQTSALSKRRSVVSRKSEKHLFKREALEQHEGSGN